MESVNSKILASVTVTVVCENTARGAGILGEHGLAWWIEADGQRLLFDLGQGLSLVHNAKKLLCPLTEVDAIALSHGHYDHLGGWSVLPAEAKHSSVFFHPAALQPKFQRRASGVVVTAGDAHAASALEREAGGLVVSSSPTEVIPGIWLTGAIPRLTKYEDTGGDFVLDEAGTRVDMVDDDQSIFFNTSSGIVVILGCAHSGVINTLEHVRGLTGTRIHAVLGGMHLLHASDERMLRTIEALRVIDPDWLGPNHCTGDRATATLRTVFGAKCVECHAGQSFEFPLS
jgi:7,8-dihydropterin-6-yl-methyl-4-(beta-D-ribofuranosyl)aminobenzene 5'-phosphate synthase